MNDSYTVDFVMHKKVEYRPMEMLFGTIVAYGTKRPCHKRGNTQTQNIW